MNVGRAIARNRSEDSRGQALWVIGMNHIRAKTAELPLKARVHCKAPLVADVPDRLPRRRGVLRQIRQSGETRYLNTRWRSRRAGAQENFMALRKRSDQGSHVLLRAAEPVGCHAAGNDGYTHFSAPTRQLLQRAPWAGAEAAVAAT
jgi:hypothetical protein